jgi:hypothetical protein
MSGRSKLRIGLLHDSAHTNQYMRDLITWAGQQDDLEISHLIIYALPEGTRLSKWRPIRQGVLKAIQLLEQAALGAFYGDRYRDHSRQFRIDHLVAHTVHIGPTISSSGLAYRFSTDDVAKVRAADCDVLIHAGNGILRGEILEASTFGVLSCHHEDSGVKRGGPPGFWESYLGWPGTGFIIQRLTGNPGSGDVLARGSFETRWLFLLNQADLFGKSSFHFKDLLSKLARDRTPPRAKGSFPSSGRLFRSPSIASCLGYMAKVVARFAGRAFRKAAYVLFRYQDRWYVSISLTGWRDAALSRAATPEPPAGRFWADPFVWRHDGKTFCLFEDYAFRERIGRISAFQIDEQGITQPESVLVEPFHLSFPYLFEFNGTIYMCPECSASRQIRLYRSTEFPRKWELVKTLMTDVSAVDTMLFEKGDRWWMLTNLDLPGRGGFHSALYLFSATSPLSESWVPHPANPLKIDPAGARNAGLLRDGPKLYRAGQVQGFERYGVGTRIYEICSLSLEEYSERLITEIHPDFRPGLVGTHHISSTGGVTVVDSYRREFAR